MQSIGVSSPDRHIPHSTLSHLILLVFYIFTHGWALLLHPVRLHALPHSSYLLLVQGVIHELEIVFSTNLTADKDANIKCTHL